MNSIVHERGSMPTNEPADNVRCLTEAAKTSATFAPAINLGPLSDDEQDFLEKWRQLSPQDRARVQRLLFRWRQRE